MKVFIIDLKNVDVQRTPLFSSAIVAAETENQALATLYKAFDEKELVGMPKVAVGDVTEFCPHDGSVVAVFGVDLGYVAEHFMAQPEAKQRAFALGDTVRLKSGGPVMTVGAVQEEIEAPGTAEDGLPYRVACAWLDDNGLLRADCFDVTSLVPLTI